MKSNIENYVDNSTTIKWNLNISEPKYEAFRVKPFEFQKKFVEIKPFWVWGLKRRMGWSETVSDLREEPESQETKNKTKSNKQNKINELKNEPRNMKERTDPSNPHSVQ